MAQKLTGNIASQGNFQLLMEIPEEGSYELQQAGSLGSWSSVINFNSFPGMLTYDEQITGGNKFYRVQRLTHPPAILTEPAPVTKFVGQTFKIESSVTGSWPLRLQWYKGGSLLPNETNNFLNFLGKSSESGAYSLTVTNSWGDSISTVQVEVVSPVAESVAGKLIRFEIMEGNTPTPLVDNGNYQMNVNPAGYYSIQGNSEALNDSGYWVYTQWDDLTAYIQTPGSVLYPNGSFKLTFEIPTTGTFLLTVPGNEGYQSGHFTFLN